jgi:hypothetical protein
MELWDEAEHNLREQGHVNPDRRAHSRRGDHGCLRGRAEDCPACNAHARAREEYREALFAEIARLRQQRRSHGTRGDM